MSGSVRGGVAERGPAAAWFTLEDLGGLIRRHRADVCPQCGTGFTPVGRRRWCSDACHQ
ncbi:MAG TPA: hypothetical protein VIU11_27575 [Nakamurella sp.]